MATAPGSAPKSGASEQGTATAANPTEASRTGCQRDEGRSERPGLAVRSARPEGRINRRTAPAPTGELAQTGAGEKTPVGVEPARCPFLIEPGSQPTCRCRRPRVTRPRPRFWRRMLSTGPGRRSGRQDQGNAGRSARTLAPRGRAENRGRRRHQVREDRGDGRRGRTERRKASQPANRRTPLIPRASRSHRPGRLRVNPTSGHNPGAGCAETGRASTAGCQAGRDDRSHDAWPGERRRAADHRAPGRFHSRARQETDDDGHRTGTKPADSSATTPRR